MPIPPLDDNDTRALLSELERGGVDALGRYFDAQRARLKRAVALRMDRRVRARLDASDVLQEAFLEAAKRLPGFLEKPDMPVFLWLRFLTMQELLQAHRRHLQVQGRAAAREVPLYRGTYPEASSAVLAEELVANRTSPSQRAMRVELKARLQEALESMNAEDREILVLKHFEHLTSSEAARVLGIEYEAAKKRYIRALKRLGQVLEDLESSI